jgi:hypothetical protein
MHQLLISARASWDTFGFIPATISQKLEEWGVNVPALERNWAAGRV